MIYLFKCCENDFAKLHSQTRRNVGLSTSICIYMDNPNYSIYFLYVCLSEDDIFCSMYFHIWENFWFYGTQKGHVIIQFVFYSNCTTYQTIWYREQYTKIINVCGKLGYSVPNIKVVPFSGHVLKYTYILYLRNWPSLA